MRIRIGVFATLLSAIAATAIVAGCSGSSGTMNPSALPAASGSMTTQSITHGPVAPADRHDCQNEDGVKVTPCVVVFNAKNPGPVTVMVDSSNHKVVERDNCTGRGIAMITANQDGTYTVTAGASMGRCHAQFLRAGHDQDRDGDGNRRGAILTVFNRL